MKHFWQEQGEKIRTILICSAIFLVMLSAIALLSSAVMRLFGFTYRSVGSIILFFLIATALSFPLCLVAGALPKALYEVGMLTSRKVALLLYLVLDTLATAFGLGVVDYYMESVAAGELAVLVISFRAPTICGGQAKDRRRSNCRLDIYSFSVRWRLNR